MATAKVHPNIALVKYWGKRDRALNLPSTGSISMTLDRFRTITTVKLGVRQDELSINGERIEDHEAVRVFEHINRMLPHRMPAKVTSHSNFPRAAGLASSSSAFAALTLATAREAGLKLTDTQLSVMARQGSGSACRSLWGGFVEWQRGEQPDGSDSHGKPLAPRDHWDVRMVVAVVDGGRKKVGSTRGMIQTQATSPMYEAWQSTWERDVVQARQAILQRDLPALGEAMERSTLKMHASMMTTEPAIRYWKPASIAVMEAVEELRERGVGAWWTMDAGPNVKVLCEASDAEAVAEALRELVDQVEVLGVGGAPQVSD